MSQRNARSPKTRRIASKKEPPHSAGRKSTSRSKKKTADQTAFAADDKVLALLPLSVQSDSKLVRRMRSAFKSKPAKTGISSRSTKREMSGVPANQMKLQVSYRSDAKGPASLKDYLDHSVPTLTLAQLSSEQQAAIALTRIEKRTGYKVNILTAGEVNRERAMAEIAAGTAVGKALVNLELEMIEHYVELARKGR